MLEKKKEYIDQLLDSLNGLIERVSAAKRNDALPFSFFRESFDTLQEVSRTLHQLEFMQIDEMRGQMERLVNFLSETGSRTSTKTEPVTAKSSTSSRSATPLFPKREGTVPRNQYAQDVVLPEYRKPKSPPAKEEFSAQPSLNDVISAPPTFVDLKRGISLNDRFLFQRELFGNDPQKMNEAIQTLGTFTTYEEVEEYARATYNWDFDDPTVGEFLQVVRKGFG
ncbi:MAG: hypothetical protein ACOX19_01560 [Fermentimonas sp.]|jgi:hypothetical protein